MAQSVKNPASICEDAGPSLASPRGLRTRHYCGLRCGSHMQVRCSAAVAVAVAGTCSCDSTPRLEASMCCACGCKKKERKKMCMNLKDQTVLRNMCDDLSVRHTAV